MSHQPVPDKPNPPKTIYVCDDPKIVGGPTSWVLSAIGIDVNEAKRVVQLARRAAFVGKAMLESAKKAVRDTEGVEDMKEHEQRRWRS